MKINSLTPILPTSAIRRRQLLPSRHYAMQAPGAPMLQVFDDNTKQLQRERAAADAEASRKVDYLRDEVASRLCERLLVRPLTPTFHDTYHLQPLIGHQTPFSQRPGSWRCGLQYRPCSYCASPRVFTSLHQALTSHFCRLLTDIAPPRRFPPIQFPSAISHTHHARTTRSASPF